MVMITAPASEQPEAGAIIASTVRYLPAVGNRHPVSHPKLLVHDARGSCRGVVFNLPGSCISALAHSVASWRGLPLPVGDGCGRPLRDSRARQYSSAGSGQSAAQRGVVRVLPLRSALMHLRWRTGILALAAACGRRTVQTATALPHPTVQQRRRQQRPVVDSCICAGVVASWRLPLRVRAASAARATRRERGCD